MKSEFVVGVSSACFMCKLEINYALLHVIVNEIMIINILIVVSTCMVTRTIRRRHFSVDPMFETRSE